LVRPTKTIPIVAASLLDPVEEGCVMSLARPGGNITGPGWSTVELGGKRLELLKEAIPKLSGVAVLWTPLDQAAQRFGKKCSYVGLSADHHRLRDQTEAPDHLCDQGRRRNRGLLSCAPSLSDPFRRAARYVDKVLKAPILAICHIEQPTRFELVINLKTAKTFSGSCQATFS